MLINSRPWIKLNLSVTALILAQLLVSCGGAATGSGVVTGVQPSQRDTVPGSQPAVPGRPQTEAEVNNIRVAARAGELSCPYPGECHPAVAMISIVSDSGIERCSGFLISPTQVMTNDHCIKTSLSLKGWESRVTHLPCKDFVYIHFAGADGKGPGISVGCREVEVRSRETGIASYDYAILKLASPITDREPLRVAKRGLSDLEPVSIYRVQMTQNNTQTGFGGQQNLLRCQTSYSTYLYPAINSPDSALMTFGDCAIQSGNSGSPILNQNGEVAGLIQGYLTVTERPDLIDDLKRNMLDSSFGQVGIGTQTNCIKELGPGRNSCNQISDLSGFSATDFLKQSGSEHPRELPKLEAGHSFREISESRQDFFETYASVPACVKSDRFSSQVIEYRKGINHFLQIEWRASSMKNLTFTQSSELSREGLVFSDGSANRVSLPLCSLATSI